MTQPAAHCRLCGNAEGNRRHTAREMMFGLRETFDYVECADCGCVQIAAVPADMGKYYPARYYSFHSAGRLKALIKGPWLCERFSPAIALRRGLSLLPGVRAMPEWMARGRIARDRSILEVGSGNGDRLVAMKMAGYRNLTGVDPYLSQDLERDGIRILKREIRDLEGTFDFVMLHHALEHMPDQLGTLREIERILAPDGRVLIRIPVASSHAWKTYGVDWVQLDAPRHFYLHTARSLRLVATQAGFEVADTFYDSDAFQFWGSEQYRNDVPLRDPRSYGENPRTVEFTAAQMRAWNREAARLNCEGAGDSAAFFLRRRQ